MSHHIKYNTENFGHKIRNQRRVAFKHYKKYLGKKEHSHEIQIYIKIHLTYIIHDSWSSHIYHGIILAICMYV